VKLPTDAEQAETIQNWIETTSFSDPDTGELYNPEKLPAAPDLEREEAGDYDGPA